MKRSSKRSGLALAAVTLLGVGTFAIEHGGAHYGQLVVYYRASNLVPPDSRRWASLLSRCADGGFAAHKWTSPQKGNSMRAGRLADCPGDGRG